jgi:hypothetical protein
MRPLLALGEIWYWTAAVAAADPDPGSYRRVAGSAWGAISGEPGAVPGFLRALTRSGGLGRPLIRMPAIPRQQMILYRSNPPRPESRRGI